MPDIHFSIVIPTYNRPLLLERAVTSAYSASRGSDQIIVVDAGEGSRAEDVVRELQIPNLEYFHIRHEGVSVSRNEGMKRAEHPFVAFLDDDDEWDAHKLEVQRALFDRHPEAAGIFTDFRTTTDAGRYVEHCVFSWGQPVQSWPALLGEAKSIDLETKGAVRRYSYYLGDHYYNQMLDDYVLPSSLAVNRNVTGRGLCFKPGMHRNESWLFSSAVSRSGPMIFVDSDLACQHGDAETRLSITGKMETVLSRIHVLENEFGKNPAFLEQYGSQYTERLRQEVLDLIKTNIISGQRIEVSRIAARYKHLGLMFTALSMIPDLVYRPVQWYKLRSVG